MTALRNMALIHSVWCTAVSATAVNRVAEAIVQSPQRTTSVNDREMTVEYETEWEHLKPTTKEIKPRSHRRSVSTQLKSDRIIQLIWSSRIGSDAVVIQNI